MNKKSIIKYMCGLSLAVLTPCIAQTALAQDEFKTPIVLHQPIVENSMDDKIQEVIFNLMTKTQEGNEKAYQLLEIYMQDQSHDQTLASYLKGLMLYQGLGTPVDKDEALSSFLDAADNYSNASYLAGYMMLHGDGVPVYYDDAIQYLVQAANQGQMDAISEFAVLNYQQSLVEKNDKVKKMLEIAAYNYAQKCAVDKRKNCILVLANVFEKGLANVPQSTESANKLRSLAANAQ